MPGSRQEVGPNGNLHQGPLQHASLVRAEGMFLHPFAVASSEPLHTPMSPVSPCDLHSHGTHAHIVIGAPSWSGLACRLQAGTLGAGEASSCGLMSPSWHAASERQAGPWGGTPCLHACLGGDTMPVCLHGPTHSQPVLCTGGGLQHRAGGGGWHWGCLGAPGGAGDAPGGRVLGIHGDAP